MIDYEDFENFKKPIIGLFGTCGNSTWREDFIELYNNEGLEYYNP
jgi:hypothetical protein